MYCGSGCYGYPGYGYGGPYGGSSFVLLVILFILLIIIGATVFMY
ncbi:YjcZ family sporulation protein [Cytobacillus sp. Hm23]